MSEHIVTLSLYTDEMVLGMVPTDKMAAVKYYLDDPKGVQREKAKRSTIKLRIRADLVEAGSRHLPTADEREIR